MFKLVTATSLLIALSSVVYAKDNVSDHKANSKPEGHQIMTPTLQKDSLEVFTCRVVNTGKRPHGVDIVILGSKGQPLETQKTVVLEPGATTSDSSTTRNTIGYCKVTMRESPKDALVTLCTQPFTGGPCQAVVTGQKN